MLLNSAHVTERMLDGSLSDPRGENQRAASSALAARKPERGQDGKQQFLPSETCRVIPEAFKSRSHVRREVDAQRPSSCWQGLSVHRSVSCPAHSCGSPVPFWMSGCTGASGMGDKWPPFYIKLNTSSEMARFWSCFILHPLRYSPSFLVSLQYALIYTGDAIL